jgi:RHS repeat-associated protein
MKIKKIRTVPFYKFLVLSQVLAEYTPTGTLIASYVYADDLISMNRNSQIYYYHFDGLGSTRLLTDASGNVTDTYDYDAFGNLINRTGTTENLFLFTGQQYDSNIGFYYLRARYYQPTNGRFISFDPFAGDPYAPMSLHKYLYAYDNPLNLIDFSGEQAELVGLMVSISISDILSKIVTPSFHFGIKLKTPEVKLCKSNLNINPILSYYLRLRYYIFYHSFFLIKNPLISREDTYGFTTHEKKFSFECGIEGPGIVDPNDDMDQRAAKKPMFMLGSCKAISCKKPQELINDLEKEASGSRYYYCLNPFSKKGINCQQYSSMKIKQFCD